MMRRERDLDPRQPDFFHALRLRLFGVVVLLSSFALSACSGLETNLQDTEVTYESTARQNFEAGDEAFTRERYNEAIKFFEHVKNKFPYSKFAVMADLRIADAHFAREKWLEAADAYRLFIRFHPRHEEVPFATWRVALSFYRDMQKGFFLTPDPHETDLSATQDAIRAFDDYLGRYPEGEHVTEAKQLRVEARSRLAQHDLYAAAFYAQREKWQGALWRYEHVASSYADTPLAAAAHLEAGALCAKRLGRPSEARSHYQKLVERFPDSAEAAQARLLLKELDSSSEVTPEAG